MVHTWGFGHFGDIAITGPPARLHHYIISMVLMPGTGFPTRLSAIYQGFLLSMFLNGAAASGFDSILQTAAVGYITLR